MPKLSPVQRVGVVADRRVAAVLRRARARKGAPVREEEFFFQSTVGYRIRAWVHRPAQARGRLPAVVLCPGIDADGGNFVSWTGPLHADEVARTGAVVLRFDPAGRGASWGEEDYSGPEHQDDVACAVAWLAGRDDVDPERIGLVGISLGAAMAVGAAVLAEAPVAWVLDWEGPCDREIITSGGEIMEPAAGHGLEDEVYWLPREPVRHVGRLRCAYVRLQAARDHAQPGETRHATRMLQAAASGDLPWFQINDHPRGEAPDRPVWGRSSQLLSNRALLRKIRMLLSERAPEAP